MSCSPPRKLGAEVPPSLELRSPRLPHQASVPSSLFSTRLAMLKSFFIQVTAGGGVLSFKTVLARCLCARSLVRCSIPHFPRKPNPTDSITVVHQETETEIEHQSSELEVRISSPPVLSSRTLIHWLSCYYPRYDGCDVMPQSAASHGHGPRIMDHGRAEPQPTALHPHDRQRGKEMPRCAALRKPHHEPTRALGRRAGS